MAVGREQSEWVRRVLGVDFSARLTGGADQLAAARASWISSRQQVLATLKSLEAAIRRMDDPLGDRAIILVKAIAGNLTALPGNHRDAAELRRYLQTDEIIDDAELPNGFGIDVRLRAPLLAALDALDTALPG